MTRFFLLCVFPVVEKWHNRSREESYAEMAGNSFRERNHRGDLPAEEREPEGCEDEDDWPDESRLNPERRQFMVKGKEFEIENDVLIKYNGRGGNVVIPYGVTEIGAGAFQFARITGAAIPDTVKIIGPMAFSVCTELTSIAIPDSVERIGAEAFRSCYSLRNVTIRKGVKTIEDQAFRTCESLVQITIPESVEEIGFMVFAECDSLRTITVENKSLEIDRRVFGARMPEGLIIE